MEVKQNGHRIRKNQLQKKTRREYAYLGGGGTEQAKVISQRADKPFNQIMNMPLDKCWLFRRGQQPILCDVFDLNSFEKELGVVYGQPMRIMNEERPDIM